MGEPLPGQGVGTVPSSAQTIPEHHFQLVPDTLFQPHSGSLKSHQKSVFEMPHDETA